MFISRIILAGTLLLSIGRVTTCAGENEPLRLWDLVRRASDYVAGKDTSVATARLELEMLEALGRTHVDFRPQLSILSFSNPIFLAASLGASISVNRRTSPSPTTLELARFALVEAEVGRAQAVIASRTETVEQFFAMAEAQELAASACRLWDTRTRDRDKILSLVSQNRIIKLDVIRFEQDATALESECVEAREQLHLIATSLARLIGLREALPQFQVDTAGLPEVPKGELPTSNELIVAAVDSQAEFSRISEHISALATAGTKRKFHFDSFNAGYGYLKNVRRSDFANQYLLGGNVGRLDTGFYLPLRNTGVEAANHSFLQSRFDRLQQELNDLKLTVEHKIEDNIHRAAVAADRLRLSKRKQQLANELRALTAERTQAGLQPSSDELWADRDAARAEADAARQELEWKRTAFTALTLSHPEKLASLAVLAPAPASPAVNGLSAESHETPEAPISLPTSVATLPDAIRRQAVTGAAAPLQTEEVLLRKPDITLVPAEIFQKYSESEASAPPPLPTVLSAWPTTKPSDPDVSCAAPCNQNLVIFVPPRPLNMVQPDVGRLNRVIGGAFEINVIVSIDENGRVIDARVPNPAANLTATLVDECIAAAKSWKFEPAKLRGRNVSSDHRIKFRFHPNQIGAERRLEPLASKGE